MRRLIAARTPILQKALEGFVSRQFALPPGRMTDLWLALAGDDITQTDFWKRYREHAVRRNGAVP